MKKIVVLGSTGSIGTQTLDVISKTDDSYKVLGLACYGRRLELFESQIKQFCPEYVAVYDKDQAEKLKSELDFTSLRTTKILSGMEGLITLSSLPDADVVLTAMVGMIGIQPTLAAVKAGKTIALANKETLCCAGELINKCARENRSTIIPVDSEHAAIFQCLQGIRSGQLESVLLTASGGPFRGYTSEMLENVKKEQALKHPNWVMGQKITIDSATLMNKGLEMIEARYLFGTKNIHPIIQPTSIVHSMIELVDGTVLAQLGVADMRLPIEMALLFPERGPRIVKKLDFSDIGPIEFFEIDTDAFPSVKYASYCLNKGGLYPAVFNIANEKAVSAFLSDQCGFNDIFRRVSRAIESYDAGRLGKVFKEGDAYCFEDITELSERI